LPGGITKLFPLQSRHIQGHNRVENLLKPAKSKPNVDAVDTPVTKESEEKEE